MFYKVRNLGCRDVCSISLPQNISSRKTLKYGVIWST